MPLRYEKKDHIVTITFDRIEALNSFDLEMIQAFNRALVDFRDDPEARVLIITGAGERAFSTGIDIKALLPAIRSRTLVLPPSIMRGLEIWKPIIAAVNGMALGGGLEVALACDIRIASNNATFGTPEVSLGVIPSGGGTQRLGRLVPRAKAAELLLMGTPIDANEAYRIGLVNKVVPFPQLMPTAQEWATRIATNGPLAVRAAKEAMVRGLNMTLEEGLRVEETLTESLLMSEDFQEGIKAFGEKRKPVYKGK